MYERFLELLALHNSTPYKVSKATGVSNGSLSDWKRGRSKPKYDALVKIADYFGVTVNYLIGNEDETAMSETDRVLASLRNDPKRYQLAQCLLKLSDDEIERVKKLLDAALLLPLE